MNDEKILTPYDAWADFWETIKPTLDEVPNELHVAQSTWKGALTQKSGHVKTLGNTRIKRLLEKYAPGKYSLIETLVFVKNK